MSAFDATVRLIYVAAAAGFVIDWALLHALRERGVGFATLTHAAGISSTGDARKVGSSSSARSRSSTS